MGIKGLTGLINDEAPNAIKEHEIKTYFGRKVAIDASMSLYQFLIAVRQNDGQQLMTESGETTSHLLGFFYRTLRMIDYGIKPMYVFDGKPPDLKKEVLEKRFGRREEAREEEEEEKDIAGAERMDQLARRQVRPTRQHNEEVRHLLKLMGIPCVVAPSEAEAQCAELCRAGKVYAAGSEDMDTLTFGTPILLKHLTASEQKKLPVHEVNLQKAIEGLGMTKEQFIDLCILLGCDYLDPIRGIGPKTALKLMRDHGSLDKVIEHLKSEGKKSVVIPEHWPFEEARKIFLNPEVQKGSDLELKWEAPDVEGMVKFLCQEKGFSEDRVRKGCEKLTKSLSQKQQGRLDGFFTVQSTKRKPEEDSKGKGGGKDKKLKSAPAKKGKK
ncbi:putative DNA repair endonuclease rad2 [Violaceomyces palustris]|uniref:DNA repair endonuclease rad2 n=1 Tax=Violaceomyces palustris TaxID=1673888 RepID=A0ACD0P5M3_9BASI|nr:putative DNA repair endonuclease rad2 [Violaceomyces palustris]